MCVHTSYVIYSTNINHHNNSHWSYVMYVPMLRHNVLLNLLRLTKALQIALFSNFPDVTFRFMHSRR
jgi:hypothetical protein